MYCQHDTAGHDAWWQKMDDKEDKKIGDDTAQLTTDTATSNAAQKKGDPLQISLYRALPPIMTVI